MEAAPNLHRRLQVQLKERVAELSRQWLDRILAELPEEPRRVFPTDSLIDSIPVLLDRVIDAVTTGQDLLGDGFVLGELSALVSLRSAQGYAACELVHEFEMLSNLFFDAFAEEVASVVADGGEPVAAIEAVALSRRVGSTFLELSRIVSQLFAARGSEDRSDRARLLQEYGRALSHELRNRANAAHLQIHLALESLGGGDLAVAERSLRGAGLAVRRLIDIGVDSLAVTFLARRTPPLDSPHQSLAALIRDVGGELGEYARQYGVDLEIADDLPDPQVDAARLQLALAHVLSSAIRFSDPERMRRWVRVRARTLDGRWRVEVESNGPVAPPAPSELVPEEAPRSPLGRLASVPGWGVALEALNQVGGWLRLERSTSEGSLFVLEGHSPAAERVAS